MPGYIDEYGRWKPDTYQPLRLSFADNYASPAKLRPLISLGGCTAPSADGSTSDAYQRSTVGGVTTLQLISAGDPRYERVLDADGREFVGSLVEAGATLITNHPGSDGAGGWSKYEATLTVDGAAAPNGRTSIRHNDSAADSDHSAYYSIDTSPGDVLCIQKEVKAGTKEHVALYLAHGANKQRQFFNLSTGAVGTYDAHSDFTNPLAAVEALGNGWYRCILVVTDTVGGTTIYATQIANADGEESYLGDGTGTIYWSAYNLTTAEDFPSSPIYTAAGPVARAADVLRYAIVEGQDIGSKMGAVRLRFLAPSFTPGRSHYLWSISDGGAAADMIGIYLDTSGYLNVESAATGGSAGAVQIATDYCDNKIHEVLCSWQEGRLDLWCDGIPGTPDSSINPPDDIDTLDVGTDESQANHAGPVLVADWKLYTKYLSSWARRGSGFVA